jgi:hypothetical protein
MCVQPFSTLMFGLPFSSPHSRAPGFTTQDHAKVLYLRAAMANIQKIEETWAKLFR